MRGAKNAFLEQFLYKSNNFTETGSGQIYRKRKLKRKAFCRGGRRLYTWKTTGSHQTIRSASQIRNLRLSSCVIIHPIKLSTNCLLSLPIKLSTNCLLSLPIKPSSDSCSPAFHRCRRIGLALRRAMVLGRASAGGSSGRRTEMILSARLVCAYPWKASRCSSSSSSSRCSSRSMMAPILRSCLPLLEMVANSVGCRGPTTRCKVTAIAAAAVAVAAVVAALPTQSRRRCSTVRATAPPTAKVARRIAVPRCGAHVVTAQRKLSACCGLEPAGSAGGKSRC